LNVAGISKNGIKARPANGSGFYALIFFGSFLYQDKKEHLTNTLPKFCQGDATVLNSSLGKPLLASPTHPLQAPHFKTIPPFQGL